MGFWPREPMIDPSSEAEIFPSPFTSNFLKTCVSSSSIRARELDELDRERTTGDVLLATPALLLLLFWDDFFFTLEQIF